MSLTADCSKVSCQLKELSCTCILGQTLNQYCPKRFPWLQEVLLGGLNHRVHSGYIDMSQFSGPKKPPSGPAVTMQKNYLLLQRS